MIVFSNVLKLMFSDRQRTRRVGENLRANKGNLVASQVCGGHVTIPNLDLFSQTWLIVVRILCLVCGRKAKNAC